MEGRHEDRRPLGNVLVATDFSAAGTYAVGRAARLPIGPGSTLTVLHVLRPGCAPEDRADAECALGYAASVAADSVARVGRKGVDVFPHLTEGTPFVEIIRGARHGRNELIVVGRHGERTFRELLLGSTAERVIRKGDTSILVVASRPAAPYARPLVAVDCSDTSRRAVELAWRLADPGLQALDVVHAYEPILESTVPPRQPLRRGREAVSTSRRSCRRKPPSRRSWPQAMRQGPRTSFSGKETRGR